MSEFNKEVSRPKHATFMNSFQEKIENTHTQISRTVIMGTLQLLGAAGVYAVITFIVPFGMIAPHFHKLTHLMSQLWGIYNTAFGSLVYLNFASVIVLLSSRNVRLSSIFSKKLTKFALLAACVTYAIGIGMIQFQVLPKHQFIAMVVYSGVFVWEITTILAYQYISQFNLIYRFDVGLRYAVLSLGIIIGWIYMAIVSHMQYILVAMYSPISGILSLLYILWYYSRALTSSETLQALESPVDKTHESKNAEIPTQVWIFLVLLLVWAYLRNIIMKGLYLIPYLTHFLKGSLVYSIQNTYFQLYSLYGMVFWDSGTIVAGIGIPIVLYLSYSFWGGTMSHEDLMKRCERVLCYSTLVYLCIFPFLILIEGFIATSGNIIPLFQWFNGVQFFFLPLFIVSGGLRLSSSIVNCFIIAFHKTKKTLLLYIVGIFTIFLSSFGILGLLMYFFQQNITVSLGLLLVVGVIEGSMFVVYLWGLFVLSRFCNMKMLSQRLYALNFTIFIFFVLFLILAGVLILVPNIRLSMVSFSYDILWGLVFILYFLWLGIGMKLGYFSEKKLSTRRKVNVNTE